MIYQQNLLRSLFLGFVLFAGMPAIGKTAEKPQESDTKLSEYDAEGERANIAVQAANSIAAEMKLDAGKRIPEAVRKAAKCIAVFPNVVEFGVIVAGKGGPGMVSCRDQDGHWGPPAVYKFGAVSVGLQAGVQSASIILLYLKDEAVNGLEHPKMSFGAKIGIQTGPIGADLDTDALGKASVASYVRSKGLFGGVNLEGASIVFIEGRNTRLYGKKLMPQSVLFGDRPVPRSATPFNDALSKFAPPPIKKPVKKPNQIVEETSRRIIQALNSDTEKLRNDPREMPRIIEEILLPVIDLKAFSKLMLSQHWRKASVEQRQRFTQEFKGMLMRTYAKYLVDYSGTQVEVLPKKGAKKGARRQLVYTNVVRPGKPPFAVNYSFWFHDGKWKAYNVTVDGLSLVHLFRAEFNREISETGLDALIDRLSKSNLETTPGPGQGKGAVR
ncbi:MAG: ABC transporter substrate-binding protein [Pseudomonadota bacterium]